MDCPKGFRPWQKLGKVPNVIRGNPHKVVEVPATIDWGHAMPSMTDCQFRLEGSTLSFALKADVPMCGIVIWAMQGSDEASEYFEVADGENEFAGSISTQGIDPEIIRFSVNFPCGASDSCGARHFVRGKTHDCMAIPSELLFDEISCRPSQVEA